MNKRLRDTQCRAWGAVSDRKRFEGNRRPWEVAARCGAMRGPAKGSQRGGAPGPASGPAECAAGAPLAPWMNTSLFPPHGVPACAVTSIGAGRLAFG